jgi:hypothetical protein
MNGTTAEAAWRGGRAGIEGQGRGLGQQRQQRRGLLTVTAAVPANADELEAAQKMTVLATALVGACHSTPGGRHWIPAVIKCSLSCALLRLSLHSRVSDCLHGPSGCLQLDVL